QAHRCALLAEDARRQGELAEATDLHLTAAKAFLQAAEQMQDNGVLASSLLLLADSHAAQAEEVTVRMRLSSDPPLHTSGASRGLTPAAAYKANAASGIGRDGVGAAESEGRVVAGGQAALSMAVVGDMEDSIMRGPTQRKDDTAVELARKFRPQMDDILELERQLSKLGLESRAGRAGAGAGRAAKARLRAAAGGAGGAGGGNPGAHLSSALGESFCLLNQSVIFGGGVATGGLTAAAAMAAAAAAAGTDFVPVPRNNDHGGVGGGGGTGGGRGGTSKSDILPTPPSRSGALHPSSSAAAAAAGDPAPVRHNPDGAVVAAQSAASQSRGERVMEDGVKWREAAAAGGGVGDVRGEGNLKSSAGAMAGGDERRNR
ncbi:unnamed protein product, partial [Sphacelaria rigidula]